MSLTTIHTYIHTYVRTCIHTYISYILHTSNLYIHTCLIHTYITDRQTYIDTHACMHTHTSMHTHITTLFRLDEVTMTCSWVSTLKVRPTSMVHHRAFALSTVAGVAHSGQAMDRIQSWWQRCCRFRIYMGCLCECVCVCVRVCVCNAVRRRATYA